MKPVNTFPQGGWSCTVCRRSFADIFLRYGCPYCPRAPQPKGPQ
jgi:hypothetical protein